jgi:hypothetical protein
MCPGCCVWWSVEPGGSYFFVLKDGNKMPKIYDKDEEFAKLERYIDESDDPRLTKFCTDRGNPCIDTLMEWAKEDIRFSLSIKRAIRKQEDYLLNVTSKYNPILAIFRLKQPQHGYTDKQQIDHQVTSRVIDIQLLESSED